MVLSQPLIYRIRNATCDAGDVNPLSSKSGEWLFYTEYPDLAAHSPCRHPWAPNSLAMKNTKFEGDDNAHCNVSFANLVYPNHLIACVVYTAVSLILCGIYMKFAYITDRKRTPAMRALGETKPMQKIYYFGVVASLVNALSCIDMKGWAGIYSLPTQQVLVEVAVGLMHCGLFILTTMWVSISQLKSSKTRTRRLETLQYVSGFVCTVAGAVLGVLEWTMSPKLQYGSKRGTITALKHIVLVIFELVYGGMGCYVGFQLLLRIRSGTRTRTVNKDGDSSRAISPNAIMGVAKLQQLQRIASSIMRYLFAVSIMVTIMVIYRLDKAISSFGTVSYRLPPCTIINAWVFFSPLTIIVFLAIFCVVGAPQDVFGERPSLIWNKSSIWGRLSGGAISLTTLGFGRNSTKLSEGDGDPTHWHKNTMRFVFIL